jgi:indolepyruvate ferredoxin oxidoreductase alpha subunit
VTGAEAIARALSDAGIRAVYSFPGSPATKVSQALAQEAQLRHAWCTNEAVAATMALAGATLSGWGTACVIKHVGLGVALDTFATGAQISEYASPCVIVEGIDAVPRTSQNVQDNRGVWASHARVVALEPGTVAECYDLTRWAVTLSARTGMPVVVRGEERVLAAKGELPAGGRAHGGGDGQARWQQTAPLVSTAATCHFHSEKRARLLARVELPCAESDGGGRIGYIVAGQLGAVAATGAPTLRLGGCWPLPERRIRAFAARVSELVVVEEGLPLLSDAVRALGLGLPVTRGELPAGVPALSPPLDVGVMTEADDATIDNWPAHFERARADMTGFPASDPRRALFERLRAAGALVCADPGVSGVLGIKDRLVDLKLQMGCAAPAAGALADAAAGALRVAVMGDTNFYHSELLAVLDNVIARRDVLHVLVLNRKSEMTAGIRTPYLGDTELEALLRGAGLAVFEQLEPALSATGPRVLLFKTTTEVRADG